MTSRAALVVLVVQVACVSGCGGESPEVHSASEERAAVEQTTATFHDALRNNDLERFMSFVADNVSFMPAGEPPVRGRPALRAWMERFLTQYRTTSLVLANREVMVGNGWAVELGTYEWGLAPAAGGPTTTDRGNYMQVWQRQPDGSWRFAREVYNSSVPAMPAAPPPASNEPAH